MFGWQEQHVSLRDPENHVQVLIALWSVLLPMDTVKAALAPDFNRYAAPTVRLTDRSQLFTSVQCRLLLDFMNDTIEYWKSYKASHSFNETREVPTAQYVCQ